MGDRGLLALSWNNHQTAFCQVLSKLREKDLYSDVTLACEGKFYLAHKLVLSTCSEYFENMLEHTPCKHPVIVLKDIGSAEVERLLSYMYAGVVKVAQNDLGQLIKAAELLKIKGLAVPDEPPQQQTRKASRTPRDEPSSPRHKQRRINNSTGEQRRDNTSTAAAPLSPRQSNTSTAAAPLSPGRSNITSTPVPLSTAASLKHSPSHSHTSAQEIEVESILPEFDPLSLPTDQLNPSTPLQEVLEVTVVKEEVLEEPFLEGLSVASGSSCNPLLVPNSQLENPAHDVTPAPQDSLEQTQHSPGPSNPKPYHVHESVLPGPSALQISVRMARYAVVALDDENEVISVPSVWLADKETKCYWPPYRTSSKLQSKAIKERHIPQDSWEKLSVRVLFKCDDFSDAERYALKAEHHSGLLREGEYGKGCRRIGRRHRSDSDSDSSVDNLMPAKKKIQSMPPDVSDLPSVHCDTAKPKRSVPIDDAVASTSNKSQCRDDGSVSGLRSDDNSTILCAVARCVTAVEDYGKMMNEKLNDVLRKLEKQKDKGRPSRPDFSQIKPDLPIGTLEDFNELNDKLETDPNFEELMFRCLVDLGGSNVKSSVKYVVDKILSHEIQTKFNWEGRIGWKTKNDEYKMGFKKTKICAVVTRVLLNKTNFTTTEEETGRMIMKYLRNAGDRCGGRSRRLRDSLQNSS